MDASLWVAKTGLNAQQTRMSVISNNLANVNTNGLSVTAQFLKTCFIRILDKLVVKQAPTTSHRLASCWVLARVLSLPKKCRVKAT